MTSRQSPETATPETPRSGGLRAIKALVIGMGVLLVLGMLGFVAALIMKLGGDDTVRAPALPADQREIVLRLGLPAGTVVRSVTGLSAAGGGLAVHVSGPDGAQSIYVVPLDGRGRILRIAVTGGDSDGKTP